MSIAQGGVDDVEATLCREWRGIRDSAAIASSLAAEHMRALIYGTTADHHQRLGVAPTIHTARLLANARRAIGLVWPQYGHDASAPDICEVTLDQMKDLGDAVDIGSGQWLATPLRIVAANERCGQLVVGTAPAEVVHRVLGVRPTYAGTSRFVGEAVFDTKENDDLVVSVDAWLGLRQSLASWTAQLLNHYENNMQPVEGLPAEHLELYAPDVTQAQGRAGRWIAAGQISYALRGPRLCRPQERYAPTWNRPSYLAHFRHGHGGLTLHRAVQVPADITLRLCFGLDTIMRTSRRVSILRHRETFSIERPLMLPLPEARVYSLGWKADAQSDADRLSFHANAQPFVMHALKRLALSPTINEATL